MEAFGLFGIIGQQGVHLFQERCVAVIGLAGQRLLEFRRTVEEIADTGVRDLMKVSGPSAGFRFRKIDRTGEQGRWPVSPGCPSDVPEAISVP
jgi:hypothetical protein